MALFCLVEVQADMPEALLEKLNVYQQTHQLESVSQAIMTVLAAFFELETIQLKTLSSGTNLLQRVAQIEAVMPRLVAQIAALEGQGSFAPLDAKQESTGAASENKALMLAIGMAAELQLLIVVSTRFPWAYPPG